MQFTTEITREEYIQLLSYMTANINDQFELWLTITFAVIIASYIAGHRISKNLKYCFAALYLSVSTLLLLLLVQTVSSAQSIAGTPQFQFGITEQDAGVSSVIGILRLLVWTGGSVVALAFILRGFGQNND
jgi:hypothetical protein